MITIKILLFFFCGLTYSSAQEPIFTQNCTIQRTQEPGECKLLEECPSVVQDYIKRKKHTRCRFDGEKEIVCCPITDGPIDPIDTDPRNNGFSRIHEKKCHEYQSAVYEITYSITLSIGGERKPIQIDKCGHSIVPLIVGGEAAKGKEFPHMALVGFEVPPNSNEVSWACGGTLISERFVLTAAHCLGTKIYGNPKYVRLGELDINSSTDDADPKTFNIEEIIPHPDYSKFAKYDDIALLKLEKDVEFNKYIRPACLPSYFESDGNKVIATGWGHTEWRGTGSTYLQKVVLDKFSQNECNLIYLGLNRLGNGIQEQSQLCAGSKDKSKDTCQGDSGGPVQVYHTREYCMYIIVGITSFGFQCGEIGTPGVYTRVYNYVDWIERTVWPNEKL